MFPPHISINFPQILQLTYTLGAPTQWSIKLPAFIILDCEMKLEDLE